MNTEERIKDLKLRINDCFERIIAIHRYDSSNESDFSRTVGRKEEENSQFLELTLRWKSGKILPPDLTIKVAGERVRELKKFLYAPVFDQMKSLINEHNELITIEHEYLTKLIESEKIDFNQLSIHHALGE